MNKSGQATCSRCSGSLAPAPPNGRLPHPVLPITKRAEVMLRRAGAETRPGDKASAAGPVVTPAATASPPGPGPVPAEIYLLATERSTGQPAPPEAQPGQTEPALGERRGRVAIGLSGA